MLTLSKLCQGNVKHKAKKYIVAAEKVFIKGPKTQDQNL